MAVQARIKFAQPDSLIEGDAGEALVGDIDVEVQATNGGVGDPVISYTWTWIDVPPDSEIIAGAITSGNIPQIVFTPDAVGDYHLQLDVLGLGGTRSRDRRVFRVMRVTGRAIPSFDAEAPAMNFEEEGPDEVVGLRTRGWAPDMEDWLEYLDSLHNFYAAAGVPDNSLGNNGDYYVNTTARTIYGPKAAGVWGSAIPLDFIPTGTGFFHVTSGAGDAAATANIRYASGKFQTDGNLQWRNTGDSNRTGDLAWTPTTSNKTLTLPNATDTLVGKATTDDLSNKTLIAPIVKQDSVWQGTHMAIKSTMGEVTTSGTSATTVASYTMADESSCVFDTITSYSRKTSVTKAAKYVRSVMYRRTGGEAPTLVGVLEAGNDQETTASDDVTIDVSGNAVRVRVTAADSDDRYWGSEMRIQEILGT